MNIALYGATGTIGRRILNEAVSRSHKISAISRHPEKTPASEGVTPGRGDVGDVENVVETVKGHDAVVCAITLDHLNPNAAEETVSSLTEGLKRAGVSRLLIVGGAGSLEIAPGELLFHTPNFPEAWREGALAHGKVLELFRKDGGGLEWTYFSPAALIEPGERTGEFRLGTDQLVVDEEGNSRISAEDYAVALVDELESPKHLQSRFTIGY
ncbi:NAD(P)-dependent oxidoreductase [bacterium]|nr:MAG: NAD(P)-dependent oxidoreductase [bacterium]